MADINITNQTGMGSAGSSQAGHNNAAESATSTSNPDTIDMTGINELVAANYFKQALYLLPNAALKEPMHEVQQILKHINESIQKQDKEISEKITELAMTAINNEDFDIAEMLLKTASIQYNDKSAEKILSTFDLNSDRTKTIECKDKKERSETYVKIAQDLIDEGHIKAAESILIIAGYSNTDYWIILLNYETSYYHSIIVRNLLDKVWTKLYSKIARLYPDHSRKGVRPPLTSQVWKLYRDDEVNYDHPEFRIFRPTIAENSDFKLVRQLDPTSDVTIYKCYYYIHKAFLAFKCDYDIQGALKLLKEADTIYPNNKEIQNYIQHVEKFIIILPI